MHLNHLQFHQLTDRMETVFKCLFFLYAAMTFNCVTFGTMLISLVMWPTFGLGALLILNRTIHLKHYHSPYMWWLVALLGAGAVSVALNLQYDVKLNIVYLLTWAFYFLLLYVQPKAFDKQTLKKDAGLLAFLYTAITEICVIVSIVMLFVGYSMEYKFEGGRILGGFVDSRLYGMFIDPNAGATCAAVSGLFMVHLMRSCRRVWQRLLLAVGVALNLFYMALSDSRTGTIVAFVLGFVYTLLYFMRRFQRNRLTPLLAIASALVIGLGCFGAPTLVKKGYNGAITLWVNFKMENPQDPYSPDFDEDSKQSWIDSMTVHRDYDLSGDISNRRFSVWKSGVEIFLKRPIAGTTYTGFTDFARTHLPETYIVNNDHKDMNTFDNEIINVMVSNGLLGLIPFLVFAFGVLFFIIRRIALLEDEKAYSWCTVCFAAVCAIAASAMFRTAVLYYISSNSVLFWSLLGFLAALCSTTSEKQGETHET